MHVLTNSAPIDLGAAGVIRAGRYMAEDLNCAELMVMAEHGAVKIEPAPELPRFDEKQDWNGRTVLFMRSGGIGDMAFLSCVLAELRRRWPKVIITVACRKARYAVFDGLGLTNGFLPTPVPVEVASGFDAVVQFENCVEMERKKHYVDCLADAMGLTLPEGAGARQIRYEVGTLERLWAKTRYPKKSGVKRLGIQVASGVRARTYPKEQAGQVALEMIRRGWEVFLFGERGQAPQKQKYAGLRNLTESGLSFRESCALIPTCDVFLAPDSSLLHIAGALDVKAVGLFAVVPAAMRTAFAPSISAIEGVGACSPCFFHQRAGIEFPKGGPCEKTGFCTVLSGIKTDTIVAKIIELS